MSLQFIRSLCGAVLFLISFRVDASPQILSFDEWSGLSGADRAAYLSALRELVVEVEGTVAKGGAKASTGRVWMEIFLQPAWARNSEKVAHESGQSCLYAGNISRYGAENSSGLECAPVREIEGRQQKWSCAQSNQVICSPLIFGLKDNQPSCVPPGRLAAQECSKKTDLKSTWAVVTSPREWKQSYEQLQKGLTMLCHEQRAESPECKVFQQKMQNLPWNLSPMQLPATGYRGSLV